MATRFDYVIELLVYGLGTYFAAGLLFAVVFVCAGVQRLDSEARDSGIGFRLLITPGVAAFWPLFLSRWIRHGTEPPVERNAHRLAARNS